MLKVTVTGCDDGVGLELSERNVILTVEPQSAADRNGSLLPGDRVVGVDGEVDGDDELRHGTISMHRSSP